MPRREGTHGIRERVRAGWTGRSTARQRQERSGRIGVAPQQPPGVERKHAAIAMRYFITAYPATFITMGLGVAAIMDYFQKRRAFIPAALLWVSRYSISGSESATIPAPA